MSYVSHEGRVRARLLLYMLAAVAALLVLPTPATARAETSDIRCVGLQCAGATSQDYVPESRGVVQAATDLDDLTAQKQSGFYDVPAPIYQGDLLPRTAEPRAVVYLSKAGQHGRMPRSVGDLTVARHVGAAMNLNNATFIVIGDGRGLLVPADPIATAAHRPRAKIAGHSGCPSRYFCLYGAEGFEGYPDLWYGPDYYGTGWWNYGSFFNYNFGSSMANVRNGDTLLANGFNGDGTRYCAQQQSEDETFSNNPIGNGNASSVALLGSTPDRC